MEFRKTSRIWLLSLCLVIFVSTAYADTITVGPGGPGAGYDYGTIQEGINAAVNDDTVIIAPDVYTGDGNRDLDFKGKAITVKSENGPDDCIIDCQGTYSGYHRGFVFTGGEDTNSVLDGITIKNGLDSDGGGIYCKSSSPKIVNCIVAYNQTEQGFDTCGNPFIRAGNGGDGGGCYFENSAALLENCIIKNNIAGDGGSAYGYEEPGGGGGYLPSGPAGHGGCGGGIYCCDSLPQLTVKDCLIDNNKTGNGGYSDDNDGGDGGDGGGVYGYIQIINCNILNNKLGVKVDSGGIDGQGGGVYRNSNINSCIVWNNDSEQLVQVTNVTFSDVQGGWTGTGNIDADPCFVDIEYHLLNTSPCIDSGDNTYIPSVNDVDIDGEPRVMGVCLDIGFDEFNDLQPALAVSNNEIQLQAFVNEPNTLSDTLYITNGGGGILHWQLTEDCNWLLTEPNSGSILEEDIVSIIVDINGLAIGKYTCQLTVTAEGALNSPQIINVELYVYPYIENSLLVPVDYETIQEAIDIAETGDVVLVAPDIYTGDGNRDLDFKSKAITVQSIDPNDSNTVAATIINCQGSKTNSHRGFYFHSGEDANSILNGLTIKNGYVYNSKGGGIYLYESSPLIENCNIIYNTAHGRDATPVTLNGEDSWGGGIYCDVNSNPTFINCDISNNVSEGGKGSHVVEPDYVYGSGGDAYGGGLFMKTGCKISLINCNLNNNKSLGGIQSTTEGGRSGHAYGGAICCASDCELLVLDSDIVYNEAYNGNPAEDENSRTYGGGVFVGSNSTVEILNCNINSNKSQACSTDLFGVEESFGGGLYITDSNSIISDCNFYSNISYAAGGGIFISGGESAVSGCNFMYNEAYLAMGDNSGGAGIQGYESVIMVDDCVFKESFGCPVVGVSHISNCIIQDNFGFDSAGAISDTHRISNCLITDNSSAGSPVVTIYEDAVIENCTIVYNNGSFIIHAYYASPEATITNCIIRGVAEIALIIGSPTVSYSNIEGGWTGTGNIDSDPCFVSGPYGDYYLSQIAAGQAVDSNCVDTGSDTAVNLGMDIYTTRTDEIGDAGTVDMGYHYPMPNPADIDGDGDVDFIDYALFADDFSRELKPVPKGNVDVDGELDEWSGDIEWMALDKVYSGNPNDVNEARFALQWDPNSDKIYAAVIVTDANHVFSDEYVHCYASDRIEIYSQGDAAGGSDWYGIYDVAQHYMVGPNTSGGSWGTWALGQTLGGDEGLEYEVVVEGEQIVYEIGVKQFDNYGGFSGGDTVVTNLAVGHTVGFDIVASTRWDEDGFGMLSENLLTGKFENADQFARYMLVEQLGGPPCFERVSDLDNNCISDFRDFAIFVKYWLWEK